jgi:hypothetical protein
VEGSLTPEKSNKYVPDFGAVNMPVEMSIAPPSLSTVTLKIIGESLLSSEILVELCT